MRKSVSVILKVNYAITKYDFESIKLKDRDCNNENIRLMHIEEFLTWLVTWLQVSVEKTNLFSLVDLKSVFFYITMSNWMLYLFHLLGGVGCSDAPVTTPSRAVTVIPANRTPAQHLKTNGARTRFSGDV